MEGKISSLILRQPVVCRHDAEILVARIDKIRPVPLAARKDLDYHMLNTLRRHLVAKLLLAALLQCAYQLRQEEWPSAIVRHEHTGR